MRLVLRQDQVKWLASRFGNRCRIKLPGRDLRPVAEESYFRIANHPFRLKHPQSKPNSLETIILRR